MSNKFTDCLSKVKYWCQRVDGGGVTTHLQFICRNYSRHDSFSGYSEMVERNGVISAHLDLLFSPRVKN